MAVSAGTAEIKRQNNSITHFEIFRTLKTFLDFVARNNGWSTSILESMF
jgi:hypothetical protein